MLTQYQLHLTRRRLSPNTIRLRLFYMRKFEAHVGDLLTATIDDIEAYVATNPDWMENTEASAVASIRSFYTWTVRAGIIRPEQSPVIDLYRVKVAAHKGRRASEDQVLTALDRAPNIQDEAMILLGAECGLRASEIAALHIDDRNGKVLSILGKGHKRRDVLASPELEELLDEIELTRMRWGYYFPGRSGGHIHLTTVWRHIHDALESNPHSLRRRAATIVFHETGDLIVTQRFLGHASPVTTELYIDSIHDDLQRALDATRVRRQRPAA